MENVILNKDQVKAILAAFEQELDKDVNQIRNILKSEAADAVEDGEYDRHPEIKDTQKRQSETLIQVLKLVECLNILKPSKENAGNIFPRYGVLRSDSSVDTCAWAASIYNKEKTIEDLLSCLEETVTCVKRRLADYDFAVYSTIDLSSILAELKAKLCTMQVLPYEVLKEQLLAPINVSSLFVVTDNVGNYYDNIDTNA